MNAYVGRLRNVQRPVQLLRKSIFSDTFGTIKKKEEEETTHKTQRTGNKITTKKKKKKKSKNKDRAVSMT